MNVKRVPENVLGLPDGVEAMTSCTASSFYIDWAGKPVDIKGFPQQLPCKLMASASRGTVSISAHGTGIIVTVRMDDILGIIEEACEVKA